MRVLYSSFLVRSSQVERPDQEPAVFTNAPPEYRASLRQELLVVERTASHDFIERERCSPMAMLRGAGLS